MNKAYENFIQILMSVINKLAPFKTKLVKRNSQGWFNGEVLENIALRDELFKKRKRSKFNVDKEIYNKARNKLHRLILQKKKKKREYFGNKLKENFAKPKFFGKHLNHLVYTKHFQLFKQMQLKMINV